MLKKLILGLALSTSAIASAAPCNDAPVATSPSRPVHAEPAYEISRTPVYAQPVVYQPPAQQSFVRLTGGMALNGTSTVRVGKSKGEFRTLELVSGWGNGTTMVKTVSITFANGQVQTLCLDKKLGPSDRSVSIDLAGNERFIKTISIDGVSRGRSAIEIRAL